MKKQQIITLFIGMLIGAVITAVIFLIFKPGNSRKTPDFSQFNKDGEKFNPGDGDFDPSNFKGGEGRPSRNKDNRNENNKVTEDKTVEEQKDEQEG